MELYEHGSGGVLKRVGAILSILSIVLLNDIEARRLGSMMEERCMAEEARLKGCDNKRWCHCSKLASRAQRPHWQHWQRIEMSARGISDLIQMTASFAISERLSHVQGSNHDLRSLWQDRCSTKRLLPCRSV